MSRDAVRISWRGDDHGTPDRSVSWNGVPREVAEAMVDRGLVEHFWGDYYVALVPPATIDRAVEGGLEGLGRHLLAWETESRIRTGAWFASVAGAVTMIVGIMVGAFPAVLAGAVATLAGWAIMATGGTVTKREEDGREESVRQGAYR